MIIDSPLIPYVTIQKTYPENTILLRDGSKEDMLFVILEGNVRVMKQTKRGMVAIATLKEGEIFGEAALFGSGDERLCASVVTAARPVRVGILNRARLAEDYRILSTELRELINSLSVELRKSTERACSLISSLPERSA